MGSRTLYSVLEQTAAERGKGAALHQPNGKGKYRTYSWNEYRDFAREFAVGLRALGIRKGDIVAIFSATRAEFYLVDLGIVASGAISAALYTSYPMADQARNLRVVRPAVIIAEDPKSLTALRAAFGNDPIDTRWLLLTGEAEGVRTVEEVRADGRKQLQTDPSTFERIRAEYTGSDAAILYLTSGATGEPKMGLVSHDGVISNIDNAPAVLPVGPQDRTIVFLPSAHIAQRVVLEMVPLRMGVPVWFSESLGKLPNELRVLRPTFFLAPPRVWERVYASIWTEVRKKSGIAQRLFYIGVGLGAEAARLRVEGKPVPGWMRGALKFFDRAVYSKIRARLGGRMRIAASGAAPLSKEMGEFYAAIGMPLVEGYGLTEGGVAALNPLDRPKPGSIGKPLPNVEVHIADDGELLIKSPSLFMGYFNDPQSTAAVLKDGWLYTGDIAEKDADGYLYITGRKKELIVSSNGKKIYPARVESLFKSVPLVNQVVLIGDKMPYVTALFTLNTQAAQDIEGGEAGVQSELQKAITAVNKQLASFEQIRKFKVLEREFTVESGELTPTMKVRRARVLENYRPLISEMYMGKDID
jgi:long-chain acyl-CoA synthetase